MQSQFTKITSQDTKTWEMQPKSEPKNLQTLICLLEDFLAKHSVWQDIEKDSMTQEALSFLSSLGFSKTKDPNIFYLKTLKVYLVTTKEKLSRQYLKFSPTWGMMLSGVFLTQKTMVSPKTEKGCILRDILEENVEEKYYLSEKQVENLMKK